MATTIDLAGQLATAVASLPSSPTRLGSDYRTDIERLVAGTTRSQIRVAPAHVNRASNRGWVTAGASVALLRRLASVTAERAYTEAAMQTDLTVLVDDSWWRALVSVRDVVEPPEIVVERVGNVVTATVTAIVELHE